MRCRLRCIKKQIFCDEMNYKLTDYLDKTVTEYGDKTAVIDHERSITYGELRCNALKIAEHLCSMGISGESVAAYLDKSVTVVCILWGILYSGNHYTFIDEELNPERKRYIAKKLMTRIILTDAHSIDECRELFGDIRAINVDEILCSDEPCLFDPSCVNIYDTDPAYINFTSGTTGTPKGVVVGHRSVIDFINAFTETFDITSDEVIGNQAPFDFDVSVKDIFSCAFTGAALVLIPRDYFVKPVEITDYLDAKKVTTIIWAVTAMCFMTTLKAFAYKVPDSISKIMFSGEVMPYKHLKKWMQTYPDAMFVNLFGPTEITCNSTYHILDKDRDYSAGIPIGRPFANEKVILLDGDTIVTESNKEGEICVGGTTLAIGYLDDDKLTSQKFTQNPANTRYREIIYRSGDFGYYDDNGDLFFTGRRDVQIKRFGHRIELSEIESVADSAEGVVRSCVIADGDRLILAYAGDKDAESLRRYLEKKLPDYMLPNSVRIIETIPTNKNGKMDRAKIKEMLLEG